MKWHNKAIFQAALINSTCPKHITHIQEFFLKKTFNSIKLVGTISVKKIRDYIEEKNNNPLNTMLTLL